MKRFIWLGGLLLLLAPASLSAQDAFNEGKQLFAAGSYVQAVEHLQRAFQDNPGNLDASYYLGRAAYESGDYETAVMAFERVLIADPDATRVKLELARAYLQLGAPDIAREYFKNVQATNPPLAVWQHAQQFIDSIDAAKRKHRFTGFLSLGAFYDDNVGNVPAGATVDIGGLPVQLDQKPRGDVGLQALLNLNHVYRIADTPYAWKNTLTTSHNVYDDETANDLSYLGLHSGVIRHAGNTIWELQGMVGHVDLQSDRYLGLLGLGLNHTHLVSRYLEMNLGLSFQDKTYYQNRDRDAQTWTMNINPVFSYGKNRLSLNFTGEQEDAAADHFDYWRTTIAARYDRELAMDFAAFAGFRMQRTDYDGREPLFDSARRDRQTVWEIGLSKTLWRSTDQKQLLAMQIHYSCTDNDSNLELYDYDKGVTLTSFTLAF